MTTSEMVAEIERAKSAMQRQIQSAVHMAVEEFTKETGLTPSAISIQMIDNTTISDVRPQYLVGMVKTTVTL